MRVFLFTIFNCEPQFSFFRLSQWYTSPFSFLQTLLSRLVRAIISTFYIVHHSIVSTAFLFFHSLNLILIHLYTHFIEHMHTHIHKLSSTLTFPISPTHIHSFSLYHSFTFTHSHFSFIPTHSHAFSPSLSLVPHYPSLSLIILSPFSFLPSSYSSVYSSVIPPHFLSSPLIPSFPHHLPPHPPPLSLSLPPQWCWVSSAGPPAPSSPRPSGGRRQDCSGSSSWTSTTHSRRCAHSHDSAALFFFLSRFVLVGGHPHGNSLFSCAVAFILFYFCLNYNLLRILFILTLFLAFSLHLTFILISLFSLHHLPSSHYIFVSPFPLFLSPPPPHHLISSSSRLFIPSHHHHLSSSSHHTISPPPHHTHPAAVASAEPCGAVWRTPPHHTLWAHRRHAHRSGRHTTLLSLSFSPSLALSLSLFLFLSLSLSVLTHSPFSLSLSLSVKGYTLSLSISDVLWSRCGR